MFGSLPSPYVYKIQACFDKTQFKNGSLSTSVKSRIRQVSRAISLIQNVHLLVTYSKVCQVAEWMQNKSAFNICSAPKLGNLQISRGAVHRELYLIVSTSSSCIQTSSPRGRQRVGNPPLLDSGAVDSCSLEEQIILRFLTNKQKSQGYAVARGTTFA